LVKASKKLFVGLMVVCFVCGVGVASATYNIVSNFVNTTPVFEASFDLSQNESRPVIGRDKVAYTAVCSDSGYVGRVTFTAEPIGGGASFVLGQVKAVDGVAVFVWDPESDVAVRVGASGVYP